MLPLESRLKQRLKKRQPVLGVLPWHCLKEPRPRADCSSARRPFMRLRFLPVPLVRARHAGPFSEHGANGEVNSTKGFPGATVKFHTVM